jgi:anti-sigma-K factor RskA
VSDHTVGSDAPLDCAAVRELAAPFVLGALEDPEAAAVRAHLATCPDPHAEFGDLAVGLEVLMASTPPVEPPASLGPRIRAAAAADLAAHPRARTAPASATEPTAGPVLTPFRARADRRREAGGWALRAAAAVAIVSLLGWNVYLQGRLGDAERYPREIAAVLEVAALPGAVTAVLTPESGSGPSGLAAVDPTGAVTLAMRGLAPTTGTEVYEAWVIAADGVPRPLGDITVDESGTGVLQATGLPVEAGIVLALTREPAPGATAPTLPIVSMGTATAG